MTCDDRGYFERCSSPYAGSDGNHFEFQIVPGAPGATPATKAFARHIATSSPRRRQRRSTSVALVRRLDRQGRDANVKDREPVSAICMLSGSESPSLHTGMGDACTPAQICPVG